MDEFTQLVDLLVTLVREHQWEQAQAHVAAVEARAAAANFAARSRAVHEATITLAAARRAKSRVDAQVTNLNDDDRFHFDRAVRPALMRYLDAEIERCRMARRRFSRG